MLMRRRDIGSCGSGWPAVYTDHPAPLADPRVGLSFARQPYLSGLEWGRGLMPGEVSKTAPSGSIPDASTSTQHVHWVDRNIAQFAVNCNFFPSRLNLSIYTPACRVDRRRGS